MGWCVGWLVGNVGYVGLLDVLVGYMVGYGCKLVGLFFKLVGNVGCFYRWLENCVRRFKHKLIQID